VKLASYDLRRNADLSIAILELRGFWKLWSACLLSSAGLPTLDGLIINTSFPDLPHTVVEFIQERRPALALIRHDKYLESPPHPRGGLIVGETSLPEVVRFFLDQRRVVAVYEAADPLLNGHNLNLLFETDSEVLIEVVGPGFDASDLQRGDLSPHESWSTVLSEGAVSEMKLVQRVTAEAYQESVRARRQKIKIKLESLPTPEIARKIRKELEIPDDLEAYLRKIDSPLLRSEEYRPVAESVIIQTIRRIAESGVIAKFRDQTGVSFPLVISTSFVDRGRRQVFWDVVSPALKFEGLRKHSMKHPAVNS
jgi:hypothetical protein